MDKLKTIFKANKKIIFFLFGVFIISIIFGSIFPLFLNTSDKKLVSEYLINFINDINSYDFTSLFFNGLFSNCGFLIVIFILGISIIGVFVIIFLFFLKGFVLGFSVSSIIINYGFKGILFAFAYIFPHQIFNIFIYMFIACYSISFSIKFILFLVKKYDFNIRNAFKRLFSVLCFSLLFMLLSISYESFLWPKFISLITSFLGL